MTEAKEAPASAPAQVEPRARHVREAERRGEIELSSPIEFGGKVYTKIVVSTPTGRQGDALIVALSDGDRAAIDESLSEIVDAPIEVIRELGKRDDLKLQRKVRDFLSEWEEAATASGPESASSPAS